MVVVGFDVSLSHTGWAIGVDGKLFDSGVIRGGVPDETKCDGPHRQDLDRIAKIRNAAAEIAERQRPELVVFEDFAYSAGFHHTEDGRKGSNIPMGKAFERAGLRYSIELEMHTNNEPPIPMAYIGTSTLKKFVTGSGSHETKKEHMLLEMFRTFGHHIKSNDEADAIGLAYVAMALVGEWEPTIPAQWEVLTGLHKKHPFLQHYRVLPSPKKAARRVASRNQPALFTPAAVQDEEGVL